MSMDTNVLTVVLQLPADPEQRKTVATALALGADFHGAKVVAASLEDEISVNEFLEEVCTVISVEEARTKAKALHRA